MLATARPSCTYLLWANPGNRGQKAVKWMGVVIVCL